MIRARLLVLVAAIALGACGASEDDYRDDANAICRDLDERGDKLEQPESLDDLARFERDFAALFQSAIDRFADLDVPDDLEDDHDRLIETFEDGKEAVEGISGADSLEQAEAAFGREFEPVEARADEVVGALGLDDCATEEEE